MTGVVHAIVAVVGAVVGAVVRGYAERRRVDASTTGPADRPPGIPPFSGYIDSPWRRGPGRPPPLEPLEPWDPARRMR